MKAQTVQVRQSAGRILCCTIFRREGRKLLARGHVISDDDIHVLETEGLKEIWVAELEPGEVGEDEVVAQIANSMGCGAVEIRPAAGGRANLVANEPSCMLVDDELLRQINCMPSLVISTVTNFSFVQPGQRIATVKSAPFAVAQLQLEAVLSIFKERGPILQARPLRSPAVGVLYTDPSNPDRARQMFEPIMRQRLERFGVVPAFVAVVPEEEGPIARSLQQLAGSKPALIMVASTTAPAGPEDTVGRGMCRAGCRFERFLAPVEPGNLLLLGYKDDIPVVSAPGCFRSAKPNVLDLILPPMLARYRVSGWEIACLGHGGLLG